MYANGFIVDEGPFRDYNSPENVQFMKELNEGYVPKEIQEKYKGKGVSVGLEDRRKDEYRPPTPPKYVAYSGEGQSMGYQLSTLTFSLGALKDRVWQWTLQPEESPSWTRQHPPRRCKSGSTTDRPPRSP